MSQRKVKDLKPGDVFDWIGGSWHGPSVIISNTPSGHQPEPSKFNPNGGIRCLRFHNDKIINPPGLDYRRAETMVEFIEHSPGLASMFRTGSAWA